MSEDSDVRIFSAISFFYAFLALGSKVKVSADRGDPIIISAMKVILMSTFILIRSNGDNGKNRERLTRDRG